jgi:hypothetical protein
MNATQELEPLGKIEFCQWAILEIMGHQRFAGLVRECNIAGQGFLSIEIPETKKQKAFTHRSACTSCRSGCKPSCELLRCSDWTATRPTIATCWMTR